jgi:hypothetical protein
VYFLFSPIILSSPLQTKSWCVPFQFQFFLVFLDFPDGIFSNKVENQWRWSVSLFQTILNAKYIRQMFIYADLLFLSSPRPDRLWGPPSPPLNGHQRLPPRGQRGRGAKPTTHLHPVPRLRICSVVQTLLKYLKVSQLSWRRSRDSSVVKRWAAGWMVRGGGVRIPAGAGNLSNHRVQTGSGTHLGSYPVGLSVGVKLPGREADLSPPSNAKIKSAWSYTSTPQCAFKAWCSIEKKHRQLYVYFYLYQLYWSDWLTFFDKQDIFVT